MSSAYLIYSSLIIQSSHMLFNTNLPITSASYGRTCRVMNTLFSLSWHLRWKKKKSACNFYPERKSSACHRGTPSSRSERFTFFHASLDSFTFRILSIPDIPAPLASPWTLRELSRRTRKHGTLSVTLRALKRFPAQQMVRADFASTKGQFTDISHFPTVINVATVVVLNCSFVSWGSIKCVIIFINQCVMSLWGGKRAYFIAL